MKDETTLWLDYAAENLESARILMDSGLFNPCLQNIQQCVEKLLKSVLVELSADLVKTHSISRLKQMIAEKGVDINLTHDECDLLDTIYLPSKYPIGSVIPEYSPDADICRDCFAIALRVDKSVKAILGR